MPRTLSELEAGPLASVERLDPREGVDGEELFRRLKAKIKERKDRG
jgi:hypothetical protein